MFVTLVMSFLEALVRTLTNVWIIHAQTQRDALTSKVRMLENIIFTQNEAPFAFTHIFSPCTNDDAY